MNFNDVLKNAGRLLALQDDQSPAEFRSLRDFADMRLHLIWNAAPWPDVMRVSSALTVTTDANDVQTATMTSDMETVMEVTKENPRSDTRLTDVEYTLYFDGTTRYIQIYDNVSTVYVQYRTLRPRLTGAIFSSTTAYASGDQVFYSHSDGTKNFYDATSATDAGDTPESASSKWSIVQIPLIFQEYLVRGIVSDFRKSNQQHELAGMEEALARATFQEESAKVFVQQQLIQRMEVIR